jgi:KDO2-lipid IV(A) lauroyltransferase
MKNLVFILIWQKSLIAIKQIRYFCEFIILCIFLLVCRFLGMSLVANFSAITAIFIGKKLSVNRLADSNLSQSMPNLNASEKNDILTKMWDNLGRIIGEYYFIATSKVTQISKFKYLIGKKINISFFNEKSQLVLENLVNITKSNNNSGKTNDKTKGAIIFSGHLGNWEIGPKFLSFFGLEIATVYRPLNNPLVEIVTAKMRGGVLIPKGIAGSRKIIEVIKSGGIVVIMADQKISEGIPVPFFNRLATTATAIARIATKYNVPIIPARVIRLGEANFAVEIKQALDIDILKEATPEAYNYNDSQEKLIFNITKKINQQLEEWISEYPEQWFWVHNRWK